MDGRELAGRLRSVEDLGIIFVTGADDMAAIDSAYRAGGDDYVIKPFREQELLHRVRAVLRRFDPGPAVMRAGDLVVDESLGQATVGGVAVALTMTEFKLLGALVRNRRRVMSKDQLLNEVWRYGYNAHVVEVHVKRLRDKLGPAGACIRTVRGQGYLFEA